MVPARGPRSPWNLQLYHSVYDTPLLPWLLLLERPYHNASSFQVIFKVSMQSDGFRYGMCTHACPHTLFLLLSPVLCSWSSHSSKGFLSAFMSHGLFLPSFLPEGMYLPLFSWFPSYPCDLQPLTHTRTHTTHFFITRRSVGQPSPRKCGFCLSGS